MALLTLSPSLAAYDESVSLHKYDFEKMKKKFEKSSTKFIHVADYRKEGKLFEVEFSGELISDGLIATKFGKREVFSIGLRNEEEDGKEWDALDALARSVEKQIPNGDKWDISEFVRDEVVYVKLRLPKKSTTFSATSNVAMNPKKPAECAIRKGQTVTVRGSVSAWFNFEDEKAGLIFNATNINFEE